jgi:hypothetical protein
MTFAPDITPVFVTKCDVPPRNVLPALARLLIDMDRRSRQDQQNDQQKLTNEGSPMMLKELSLNPVAPWMMQSCPSQN